MRSFVSTTLAATAVIAALAGCASAPKPRIDTDPAVDLGAYKTFAFVDAGSGRYTTLLAQRLQQSTRAALEKQGYAYSEQSPDLRVNFIVNFTDKQELHASPAAGRFGFRGWGTADLTSYREGALRIDLIDTSRNALVWRGMLEGRLDTQAARDPAPMVQDAVVAIFAGFPHGKVQ